MGAKRRTINLILDNKINDWIKSIEDEQLQNLVKKDAFLSGGAITSLLLDEKINDYDVYFKTEETAYQVACYYVEQFKKNNPDKLNHYVPEVKRVELQNRFGKPEERIVVWMKSAGVIGEEQTDYSYFELTPEAPEDRFMSSLGEEPMEIIENRKKEKAKYRPIFMTDNAITLSDKIQLIIRFHGQPEDVHKSFDFAHTHNYFDYEKRDITLHPLAMESLLSKDLKYLGSYYPIATLFRLRKFLERGWRISAGEILKIVWQINELDLNNKAMLRDQLIGVDLAYMTELIHKITNTTERVDSSYIAKLIDKIFDKID
jgi:hypothetical protein